METNKGEEKSVVEGQEISPLLQRQILIQAQMCVSVRILNANGPLHALSKHIVHCKDRMHSTIGKKDLFRRGTKHLTVT